MASARPIAVVRFSAKIDTSVKKVTVRSTPRAPRIAITPTATGSAAANKPPNTHTSTRKLSGTTMASSTSRSRLDCSVTCRLTMAVPPERTSTPSRSPSMASVSSLVYSCCCASVPTTPVTISPDFRSWLTRAAAAAGGEVHAELIAATCPEPLSWPITSCATDVARGLSKRSGTVTTTASGTSPCPNFSVSCFAAREDSAPGS